MSSKFIISLLAILALFIISCNETPTEVNSPEAQLSDLQSLANVQSLAKKGNNDSFSLVDNYIVQFTGDGQRVRDAVANVGGTFEFLYDQIGVASVKGIDANKAAKLQKAPSVNSVTQDIRVNWLMPSKNEGAVLIADYSNPPSSGDDDFFFDLQWGHDAVNAPEAWNKGYRGAGARVGVLDTGFDLDHPDLVPNIDFYSSIDFTGEGLQYSLPDVFSHGTHTAGTIAAADNGFGTIGVAPEAELVLVKVLSDAGSGTFGNIIRGIIWAASNEVDVINMSLGAYFAKKIDTDHLINALQAAIRYAYQNGVTVVASAGNGDEEGNGYDMDHLGPWMHIPGDLAQIINISATTPVGWAADPLTDLDVFTSYSNYGQSTIDFAAPGGDILYPYNDFSTIGPITHYTFVFDLVFSTGNGGWYWSGGTSMATPHAAGVAALLIGKNGGSMAPGDVVEKLKMTSDDLGKPGKDDFYGHGRVNAYKAVTQ